MKNIITKAAAILVMAAMLSSCGIEGSFGKNINNMLDRFTQTEATPAPTTETAAEGVPEVSNTFALGVTDLDTWNPLYTKSSTVKEAMELVYEPLFGIAPDHQAYPVLASGCWVSADGRTVEVTINDSIKWQDGEPFDAYDVAYTVKHILKGDTNYSALLSDVEDYKALNGSVIRFVLKRSVPDFASLLTFPVFKYQSSMEADAEPLGTGPYSFYGKVSTDKYMLIANDIYHGGRAAADAVYITVVPDLTKYHLMFEASEFDLMTDSTMELADGMPNGNLTLHEYVSDKMCYIGFNTKSSVLRNAETRRGIAHLIDKDAIATKIIYSSGVPADIPINPKSYLYYDISASFGIEYENAYDEFEKDGWESQEQGFTRKIDGVTEKLKITLLVNLDNESNVELARYIEADMERYGVDVVLDKQPYDDYLDKINEKDYDTFIGEFTLSANGDLTPLTGTGNCFSYSSSNVNTIIAQCGMTQDIEQRKSLFIQLGQEITTDMPFAPIYFSKGWVIAGTKIKSSIEPTVSADYRNSNAWRVK